jgi:apolipoprotein N-acyltransferase
LGVGFACFAPQLECFWRIFGAGAIALWLILAFWIGLFVALAHLALARLGLKRAALLIPFLWTGLEYFRSELYYLRFSWLNGGFAFADSQFVPFGLLGNYGVSFAIAALAAILFLLRRRHLDQIRLVHVMFFILLTAMLAALAAPINSRLPRRSLVVAGVQLEFPNEKQIIQALDKIVAAQQNMLSRTPRPATNVDLVVLSEYTLDAPPTERLKEWCRANRKFLIVGGKDPMPGNDYYNTAFVISTNGEIVFKQVKSVPIQFFRDGLPAPEQKLWDSPWGRIGICICYDLSYVRVTDELVRQGAQMLIVPTMDVVEWGRHQHELHARVASVRAAEYGIPIFRLASSGIWQGVSRWPWQNVTAPFPGEGEMIFFGPTVNRTGSLPLDRWLAPLCVGVTGLFVIWLVAENVRRKRATNSKANSA